MQTLDIEVSRRKFRLEIDTFKSGEAEQRKRGIFLLSAEFPNAVLSFAAHRLSPAPIVFVVKINFDNYDLEPPSIRFIHPFTWENLPQLSFHFVRKIGTNDHGPEVQLLDVKDDTSLPFFCIPGVREYHQHPAHTGDPWLLRRGKGGEGSLGFLIEQLYIYGTAPITQFQIQFQTNVQVPAINSLGVHPDLLSV